MRRSIANVRCNFSTIVSRRFIGVPNGGDGASCNQGAASNATQSSQTDVVSDLREAISKSAERRKEAQSGNSSAPVGGPRRVTKPLFFESEKSGMSSKKPVRNEFLRRLDEMEEDSKSTSFPTYDAAAERRRKKVDTLIKEERAKLVVFRDVGMDLDKPILSRDILLIFKYFRYGKEFAIDNELERMLRYFNEHAVNELKIIQDSKLMRGSPTLSPRRKFRQSSQSGTSSSRADGILGLEQSEQFQISSSFPVVQCASMNQFCNFSSSMLRTGGNADGAASEDGVSAVARRSSASFLGKFFAPLLSGTSPGVSSQKPYSQKNKDLFSTLSPSSFRRPAVVIFSQLGQQFGAKADLEWRQLAFQTICPSLAEQLRASTGDSALKDSTSPKVNTKEAGTTAVSQPSVSASSALVLPIDVVSLRSADIYKYKWVQRLYVNRFARSLSKESSSNSDKHRIDAFTACTTFVGSQLLLPFYESMNLRNYLLPHVFLVDHEGVVRWMSGGCPDAFEKNIFKSLLKQLEAEYYQSKR